MAVHGFMQKLEHLVAPKPQPPGFLDLCEEHVICIENLVNGGNLLNQNQCRDLALKLTITTGNIRKLVEHCGGSADLFRPLLENLYLCLEKAKLLVGNCGEQQWWKAAVFQSQNQNAFYGIVLEVSLCYNVIYELAKSKSKHWSSDAPDDLRQPDQSVFVRAIASDVQEDQQNLQQRLEDLANDPSSITQAGLPLSEDVALKAQCLAKYLLSKTQCTSEQSLVTALDKCSGIMWQKATEPPGTWGNSDYLGGGITEGGVCKTEWLGVPCARKEYHAKAYEVLFLKEAGILAHLKHPSIIDFICCSNGEEKRDRFIAMELMEKSLLDIIEKQKDVYFPLPVVFDVVVQIAHGMCYLHDQGVAHRDLKPQNVVVKRLTSPSLKDYFCVKLVDFGASKVKLEVSKSNTMTARGIGTTLYRAPEIHPSANSGRIGRAVWFKADVFSFAMTCVHLLCLKAPFKDIEGISSAELYNELMNGRRPIMNSKYYPKELIVLLKECWNTIPQRRPSFLQISIRLEALRDNFLRGFLSKSVMLGSSLDFIRSKMEEQSAFYKTLLKVALDNLNEEDESDKNDNVSILPCICGCALEVFQQPPSYYIGGTYTCNICRQGIDGEFYHCATCQFDAHPHCVEIKKKANVFFHDHTLHLLVQNFYINDPQAVCHFCEESMQESEWVYRCEQCDFDVHAQCTKFPREVIDVGRFHPHLITLIPCPPNKSMSCTCCSSKVKEHTRRYTCQLQSCGFNLHTQCILISWDPLCIFDISHRLSLVKAQRSFYCAKCGARGLSWFYHCKHCEVDIHIDCVYPMGNKQEEYDRAYQQFMMDIGSMDNPTRLNVILELLDKLPNYDALNRSSSLTSGPLPVMTSVQPSIPRLPSTEGPLLDASKDADLQRQIASETIQRIETKKMAAKEAKQKLWPNLLEMLEHLERIISNLPSTEIDAEALAGTHKKLKSRQALVKERMAMQVQSKMGQGPRIAVFSQNIWKDGNYIGRKLLTSLQADMKGVRYALLCEKPGHEHVVDGKSRIYNREFGEERAEKLQALVAPGLQVVRKAIMRTLEPHELTALESVTLPCLEDYRPWDLRAIARFEEHGNESSDPVSEDTEQAESLERAVDSAAEWFRSDLEEYHGRDMLKFYGLQRVRYKLREESDDPKYRGGSMAWLCSDHVSSGLKAGTLESYPLKYYDVEVDHQLRFPTVSFGD
ncbi:hypothetical protein KC19_5G158600 [Ceratodon purpureus]|uniref:Protein kinase domain-containing protein n=1 Tax=Ceratodon purpureus TaxID=3225 RepID=A0A8T0I3F4_CERPU|nr:hypothetical protein KC19_5G158600 [Ceratodon purpureus]